MPIDFPCPICQKLLRVPDEAAGKQARCPQCSSVVPVPVATMPSDLGDDLPRASSAAASLPSATSPAELPPSPPAWSAPLPSASIRPPSDVANRPPNPSFQPNDDNPFSSPALVDDAVEIAGVNSWYDQYVAALARVQAPAIALMIFSVLTWLASLAIFLNGWINGGVQRPGNQQAANEYILGVAVIMSIVTVLCALQFYGALRMKRMDNYPLAIISAVITTLFSPWCCCFVSLPFGIWALVVLLNSDVQQGFRHGSRGNPARQLLREPR